jgi:hypothetical protein
VRDEASDSDENAAEPMQTRSSTRRSALKRPAVASASEDEEEDAELDDVSQS